MFSKPQAEHRWLEPFVGQWSVETECRMGPDQPPTTMRGRAVCRSLGGLWIMIEGEGEIPDGNGCHSIMTLGYDPVAAKFVGTFVATVMTHLWLYSGGLDATKRRLVLDTTGPKMTGDGVGQYQDSVELIDHDHWVLSSRLLSDDGQWLNFMNAHHRRVG